MRLVCSCIANVLPVATLALLAALPALAACTASALDGPAPMDASAPLPDAGARESRDATVGRYEAPVESPPDGQAGAVSPPGPDAALRAPGDGSTEAAADDPFPDGGSEASEGTEGGPLPIYAPVGTACKAEATEERLCGACGTQRRLCLPGEGASGTWLDWGPCVGEKADAAPPQTILHVACARCGVQAIVYDSQCRPAPRFCEPAPQAECEGGDEEWAMGLSCQGELGRHRRCTPTCRWEPYSDCAAYAAEHVLVPTTAASGTVPGAIVSQTVPFTKSPPTTRLLKYGDHECPLDDGSGPDKLQAPYAYVEVRNTTAHTLKVDLWHSAGDTEMAVYSGVKLPAPGDDVARRNCITGTTAADYCPRELRADCRGHNQISTAGIAAVEIPAKSSITVWNALRRIPSGVAPTTFTLNVRTVSIN